MPSRLGRPWMARQPSPVVPTRNSFMRTARRIVVALILGAAPVAVPGFAFDGAPAASDAAIPIASAQSGAAAALKKAVPVPSTTAAPPSLTSLQYAAEGG